jgi:hypothetical protein
MRRPIDTAGVTNYQFVSFDENRFTQLVRLDPRIAHDINALRRKAGLSRAHFYRLFERSTRRVGSAVGVLQARWWRCATA